MYHVNCINIVPTQFLKFQNALKLQGKCVYSAYTSMKFLDENLIIIHMHT